MSSIIEVLIIQLLCFAIVINSKTAINFLKLKYIFFNENMTEFINFYEFICEHNPLILNYLDEDEIVKDDEEEKELKEQHKNIKKVNFEDKYIEKFKKFPTEFKFTEDELDQEKKEYEQIKINFDKNKCDSIYEIKEKLSKINEIQENGNIDIQSTTGYFTTVINDFGIDSLRKWFDIQEEDIQEEDFYHHDENYIEELYLDLLKSKEELLKKMTETEKIVMTEEEMRKKARDTIINKKLDKYIDNYIIEYTPSGNICMRYNNDKKSFEYFSNNSIPYRYLEPVGRKYVMTYWCKSIFIDIEEELKRAEEKYDEDQKKKQEDKKNQEIIKQNPKNILAQLKNYNKETKEQTFRPMKNRTNNTILPPQIQSNLPVINKPSEKHILKEHANRYTWEGRLTNFCPLKKIDKKTLDKKLTMTYADFKKIQKEQQK